MSDQSDLRIRVARRYKAPAERVFDAWLDPASLGRWLFATPEGRMVRVEVEPRVGGGFAVVERRDGEDVLHSGVYLEIDRPRRLVFTLQVPKYSEDIEQVTVEIEPLDTGCELVLAQAVSPAWASEAENIEQGWAGIIEALAGMLEREG